jgi:hypothetical protein
MKTKKKQKISLWSTLLFLSYLSSFLLFFFAKKQILKNSVFERRKLFFPKKKHIFHQVTNLLWCYGIHKLSLDAPPWSLAQHVWV